jgi:hypothetical protein
MFSRKNLILKIIKKKLYEEIDEILAISRQGFDVFAQVDFVEVGDLLVDLMEQELKVNPREFRIYNLFKPDNQYQEQTEDDFLPTIVIGDSKPHSGYGFVHYHVKSPDLLIGNVAGAVEMILDYFKQDFYIDAFDSKKLSRLKQIARVQGLPALIDAVISTAYYGGYKGDSHSAQNYLDKGEFQNRPMDAGIELPVEECAKRFLAYVMGQGKDAHSFIKTCLSYYVVSRQGHTMTRASQILNISRTTLQEHLKIANQLGVCTFLD